MQIRPKNLDCAERIMREKVNYINILRRLLFSQIHYLNNLFDGINLPSVMFVSWPT